MLLGCSVIEEDEQDGEAAQSVEFGKAAGTVDYRRRWRLRHCWQWWWLRGWFRLRRCRHGIDQEKVNSNRRVGLGRRLRGDRRWRGLADAPRRRRLRSFAPPEERLRS